MNLKFEFSLDETNLVLQVLAKQPLELTVGLWSKVKQSAEAQVKAAELAAVEPKKAAE